MSKYRRLCLIEREELSRGLARGQSLRVIAEHLGRQASTVSREVRRNAVLRGVVSGGGGGEPHALTSPAWREPAVEAAGVVEGLCTARLAPIPLAGADYSGTETDFTRRSPHAHFPRGDLHLPVCAAARSAAQGAARLPAPASPTAAAGADSGDAQHRGASDGRGTTEREGLGKATCSWAAATSPQ